VLGGRRRSGGFGEGAGQRRTGGRVRPIRVALVTHSFDCGGIERSIAYLASYLPQEAFDPLIVCLTRSGTAERWLTRPVTIVELHKPPRNDARVVLRLAALLRERRVDIVHSHNWGTLVETVLARRLAGTPVHVHSERGTVLATLDYAGWRSRARAAAMRAALSQVDLVVSNARATAERIERLTGYPARRVCVVPNGVVEPINGERATLRATIRRQLGVDDETLLVGTVARLDPVKDLAMFVRGLALARQRGARVAGLVVGDGPEGPRLRSLAAELGVEDAIHFVGYQDRPGGYYAAMDVYANTSRSEGMSQAIVEAMAAGLPIVATPVGDTPRLIGGQPGCGVLVPVGSAERFCDAIVRLAADQSARRDLGRAARRRFETENSLDVMIERYTRTYEQLLSRRLAGSGGHHDLWRAERAN